MIPNDWKIMSLGEICSNHLQTGPFGSQLHSHEYVENGIPVLMPKDLNDYRADLSSAAKITPEKANDLKKHILKKGDLLFSRRGDVARFALIDEKSEGSICGTGCLKARPNENHSSKFLAHFLQKDSVKQWLEQNAVGQTMPNMNTEILRELPLISASSRKEEEKIALILSTWDKAIETVEKLVANSQQQKKALMQQLLTGQKRLLDDNGVRFSESWEEKSIKSILTISKGQQLNRDTLNTTSVYPVINGGIVPSGYTDEFNTKANTITISEGGNSCGYVSFQKTDFWCGGHCYALKKLKLNLEFTYHLLKFNEIQIMRLRVGSGLPNIQKKDLENLMVSFPTNSHEQEKIAQVLTLADREIDLYQQQLDKLKLEKKALMQQLLTGQKRVTVN